MTTDPSAIAYPIPLVLDAPDLPRVPLFWVPTGAAGTQVSSEGNNIAVTNRAGEVTPNGLPVIRLTNTQIVATAGYAYGVSTPVPDDPDVFEIVAAGQDVTTSFYFKAAQACRFEYQVCRSYDGQLNAITLDVIEIPAERVGQWWKVTRTHDAVGPTTGDQYQGLRFQIKALNQGTVLAPTGSVLDFGVAFTTEPPAA